MTAADPSNPHNHPPENAEYVRIEWEPWTPPETCGKKRGKRGTVTCEKPRSLDHDEHAARGIDGRWFMWPAQIDGQVPSCAVCGSPLSNPVDIGRKMPDGRLVCQTCVHCGAHSSDGDQS